MNKADVNIKVVQKPIPIKDMSDNSAYQIDKSFQMLHETLILLQSEVNDLRKRVYDLEHP